MYDNKKDKEIVFGLHPVMELINEGTEINKIMIQKGLQGNLFHELRNKLRHSMVNIQLVPVQKLNSITRKNHQGVIAFISPIVYHKVEDLLPTLYENGVTPKFLVLDGITDVRNFGSIARSAECFGFDAILIPQKGGANVTPDAIKTSAGALLKIPVCKVEKMKDTVKFLSDSGLTIYGCSEKTEDTIYDFQYDGPIAIIMGSEENGISVDLMNQSHHICKIPMTGTIASMNVAVAAGVIMYEAVRK